MRSEKFRIVDSARQSQCTDHCRDNGQRRVFGPAAARHQAGNPFPDGPHGVRETVPNRGAMARDFTAERRHHTPSARRSRWSADRYREMYSSRVVASFMRAALVFRA
jgi:hypothetical protein